MLKKCSEMLKSRAAALAQLLFNLHHVISAGPPVLTPESRKHAPRYPHCTLGVSQHSANTFAFSLPFFLESTELCT